MMQNNSVMLYTGFKRTLEKLFSSGRYYYQYEKYICIKFIEHYDSLCEYYLKEYLMLHSCKSPY